MKRSHFLSVVISFAISPGLAAREVVRDGAMEKLALFDPAGVETWLPAECTVETSATCSRGGITSLHWHVPVDYFAGEAKYPVGWPRVDHAFPPGSQRDWSDWDYLHLWVYTDTSRPALPGTPAGLSLQTPDRTGAYERALTELKKGEWIELNIPLTQIPRHHDVRRIQFHVAESNYKHGDQLDFYLNDLALLRYAVPTLLNVVPESAVMFADVERIPVSFQLAGLKRGERAEVVFELWREGRVALRTAVQAGRGLQRVVMDLGRQTLSAGNYEVRAGLAGNPERATAGVRLVESPWR